MVNSSKVYTVLLVEDDGPTRERLATAVNKHDQLQVPWQFATLKEGLNQLEKTPPDVVLTDLGLPDGHGIELIRRARQLSEAIEIMVISVFGDERNVVSAIEAGATGYLLKDGPADYIGESVGAEVGERVDHGPHAGADAAIEGQGAHDLVVLEGEQVVLLGVVEHPRQEPAVKVARVEERARLLGQEGLVGGDPLGRQLDDLHVRSAITS